MLRRVVGVILVVLGLASIAVAVASATVWRPSDVVTARASADDAAMMVTAPGVIDLVGDEVTVTATTPGDAPVVIVLGAERDVAGWIGADPFVEVTGLESWTALATRAGQPGEGEPTTTEDGLPDPSVSDMWLASARGEGSASLTWSGPAGRTQVLVVAPGAGGVTPELELSWPREVATPLLVPGVVVGSLLVLAGVALVVSALVRARGPRGAGAAVTPRSPGSTRGAPLGHSVPAPADGAPVPVGTPASAASALVSAAARSAMTRRELRELAEREAAEREAAEREARAAERRSRPRTGILPAVRRATPTGQVPHVPEPTDAQAEAAAPAAPEEPAAPDANRADAWRQAWGFGQTSWAPVQPPSTPVRGATPPDDHDSPERPGGTR